MFKIFQEVNPGPAQELTGTIALQPLAIKRADTTNPITTKEHEVIPCIEIELFDVAEDGHFITVAGTLEDLIEWES